MASPEQLEFGNVERKKNPFDAMRKVAGAADTNPEELRRKTEQSERNRRRQTTVDFASGRRFAR